MSGNGWEPVIGLEIHVQLNTESKMFCACANIFGADPNTLTCPVCLGHPGALPTINAGAVAKAIQIGLALDCDIAPRSQFHRKNYFYPDSPKAYQISQYDQPICVHGHLDVDGDRVGITRAHLEEDAAKLVHAGGTGGRIAGADSSVVDFNRCGTPLVEIVTEPDLRSPEQAVAFLGLLKNTLQTIGVSDCDMEKGSLRCDANVSVRRRGEAGFGTKTELKNMNSFKFLGEGMAAEIRRQIDLLESGAVVRQETLHYDPQARELHARRSKEEADDYRYFPEPDLVPLEPSAEDIERLRAAMPELPAARIARFRADHGLSVQDASDLNAAPAVADYFEAVAAESGDAKAAADWVRNQPERGRRRPRRRACGRDPADRGRDDHRHHRQAGVRPARGRPRGRSGRARRAARAGVDRRLLGARGHGGRGAGAEPAVRRAVPGGQGGRDQRARRPGDEADARPRRRPPGAAAAPRQARRVTARGLSPDGDCPLNGSISTAVGWARTIRAAWTASAT